MNINLYSTSNPRNKLSKTLTSIISSIPIKFKNKVDIINPIITINTDTITTNKANYCYIDSLDRYYFIEKKEIESNGLYTLYLHVDVLETYKTTLNNFNVVFDESTSKPFSKGFNNDVDCRVTNRYYNFTNPFNSSGSIILTAVNGVRGSV